MDSACSSPQAPAPLQLKHLASDNVEVTPVKRKRARISAGAEALEDVADALREIRESLAAPLNIGSLAAPTTPE